VATVDQGRIVVVAAGFALWTGGRCVAAARFSDIRRLRVTRPAGMSLEALALRVELTDGSIMELRDAAPGFDLFVDRARTSLKGMVPAGDWHETLATSDVPADGVVIFEKPKGW
jgi:hypothetical protein